MDAIFVARLTYLKIGGSLGRGIQISDDFYITNDKAFIGGLIENKFAHQIGTLEYNFLLEGPVAYCKIANVDEADF